MTRSDHVEQWRHPSTAAQHYEALSYSLQRLCDLVRELRVPITGTVSDALGFLSAEPRDVHGGPPK